jgi:hypothetical protein
MRLKPYSDELPLEDFPYQTQIECMKGYEMSEIMHQISCWCKKTKDDGVIVWDSRYYVITLWFEKEKHKTWINLIL